MTDGNRLNYMRVRYYSAEIRRFVNQDILLGSIADGQSLNRFAFVTGNPVSNIDPFGLDTIGAQSNIQVPSFIIEIIEWLVGLKPEILPSGLHAGFAVECPGLYGGEWNFAGYFGLDFGMNIGAGKMTVEGRYTVGGVHDLKRDSIEYSLLLKTMSMGTAIDAETGEFQGFSVGRGIAPGGVTSAIRDYFARRNELVKAYVNNMVSINLSTNPQVGILFDSDECQCER